MSDIKKHVPTCNYKHSENEYCKRRIFRYEFCEFHTPLSYASRLTEKRFLSRLQRLIQNEDGDWRGFIFPEKINLNNQIVPIPINASKSTFESIKIENITFQNVVIKNSQINGDLELQVTKFRALNISYTVVTGKCIFSNIEIKNNFQASKCHFQSNFLISGEISGKANFNESIFDKQAQFTSRKIKSINLMGPFPSSTTIYAPQLTKNIAPKYETKFISFWKNFKTLYSNVIRRVFTIIVKVKNLTISLSGKIKRNTEKRIKILRQRFPHKSESMNIYYLFSDNAYFLSVIFSEPRKVLFKGVDLRRASFGGTDLREVSFVSNNWYQKKLKRNGLIDDIRQRECINYNDKLEMLPALEDSYRNIRYSLESGKDFSRANDFFIGEMEAKRRQLPFLRKYIFSITAWYHCISLYGTSPVRCFLFFCIFAGLHSFLIGSFTNIQFYVPFQNVQTSFWALLETTNTTDLDLVIFSTKELGSNVAKIFTYSLQTMTLQREKLEILTEVAKKSTCVAFINTLFSISGPVLAALFALTIRTKIKRH